MVNYSVTNRSTLGFDPQVSTVIELELICKVMYSSPISWSNYIGCKAFVETNKLITDFIASAQGYQLHSFIH